jgi:2-oxoglutarate dehydrogenase E2 component (dihydrolipoamide succinyltransferase)
MTVEIRVPALGESITEATVGKWFKRAGEAVKADEPLCELETEKVTVEVPSPATGVLSEIRVGEGATVAVGTVLGAISEATKAASPEQKTVESKAPVRQPPLSPQRERAAPAASTGEVVREKEAPAPTWEPARATAAAGPQPTPARGDMPPSPAARKMLDEQALSLEDVAGSGKRGQVLKEDVMRAAARRAGQTAGEAEAYAPAPVTPVSITQLRAPTAPHDAAREERVRMTRLRQTIARRLKEAQNTAAMLTTFNDVDMSAIMNLRNEYRDLFEKRHRVRLGFIGFFVKASVQALKEIPAVNAELDGADIIYKNYYHIGVAVSTDKGLVVPVVREADRMSLAEIEHAIADFARRAREGRLGIEEMQGGTFTITNGGVFGSLLSTPILNAPQSGILGMHRIEERPVVRNGQIVARPMMNLALTYDHRIVDGREAVTFLVRVKEYLEDPHRFILEL